MVAVKVQDERDREKSEKKREMMWEKEEVKEMEKETEGWLLMMMTREVNDDD